MTIRKLLVPLIGSKRDEAALATAFVVAKAQSAHVEGLFVRPDPSESLPYMGEGVSGPVIQDIMNAAKEAADQSADAARSALERAADAAGVPLVDALPGPGRPSAAYRERTGPFVSIIGHESRLSDLILFVNGKNAEAVGLLDAMQDCLMSAGRPILLAPTEPASAVGSVCAIGWDGSAEAAHAVKNAIPFLMRAGTIHVFSVDDDTEDEHYTALRDYLKLYGLEMREHTVKAKNRPVGEVLLAEADAAGADLLVMGGYGHSRIRELFLGGATRHVLSHASMPVLLSH